MTPPSSGGGANVPKFGTFKARQSNHQISDRGAHRERFPIAPHKHDSRISKRDKDNRPSRAAQSNHSEQEQPIKSDVFFVDLRGDPNNIQYGGLHRGDIPSYRRVGSGSVIGQAPHIKIDTRGSTDRAIVFRSTAPDLTIREGAAITHASDDMGSNAMKESMTSDTPSSEPAHTELHQNFVRLKATSRSTSSKVDDGIWDFIEQGSQSEDGQRHS